MPCTQRQDGANYTPPLSDRAGPFTTEADCLEACQEGACCNGTTCSVKPQCQCNAAAGEVFKGVGTVCSPNPCGDCPCGNGGSYQLPSLVTVRIGNVDFVNPLAEYQCEATAREVAALVLENTLWTFERQGQTNEFAINRCQTFGVNYCGSVCEGKLVGGNFSNRPSVLFPCGQNESFGQYNSSTQRVQWGVIKFENCPPASNDVSFSYALNMSYLRSALSIVRGSVQCDGSRPMLTSASVASEGQLFVTHLLGGVGGPSCGTVAWNITGTTIYEAIYANPLP